MSSLIPKGSEASRLMQEFQSTADEAMQAQRSEQSATAQAAITADTDNPTELLPSGCDVRAYRAARQAEERLIVNPDVPVEEMSASDYRKMREAEQRGERPRSYKDYVEGR